jgi:hypothetical protein
MANFAAAAALFFTVTHASLTRLPAPAGGAPLEAEGSSVPDVPALIADAASRYGLDAQRLSWVAACESQLGAHARTNDPGSPFRGIFQFEQRTWQEQAPRYGLPGGFDAAYEPTLNVELAAALIAAGQGWRWPSCRY